MDVGLVNPIIMMKNIGDYMMTFSSTILLGSAASTVVTELTRFTLAAMRMYMPSLREPPPRGVLTTNVTSPASMRSTAVG